jgi:hypothetical protein
MPLLRQAVQEPGLSYSCDALPEAEGGRMSQHPVDLILLKHSRHQSMKMLLTPQPPRLPWRYRAIVWLEGWLWL